MLTSLSRATGADKYVAQVIAMEPCIIAGPDQYYPGDLTDTLYTTLVLGLNALGIESIFGANWPAQVALIC